MEFSEMYSREPFFFFGAFDTSKFNKNERAALEAMKAAASQLQVLHECPIMQVGVTFDSSLQLPLTVGDVDDMSEEEKAEFTLTQGPYTRLTIPPLISSQIMPIKYRLPADSSGVSAEYSMLARSVWELTALFLKQMEEGQSDLLAHLGRLGPGLYGSVAKVLSNVIATLKTIEPPAAFIEQDAA